MKKNYLILLFLIISIPIFAQYEASYWYFGQNAGLHFNASNGSVTAITDGQLNTLEGCTSISDSDGNLLFYSDGSTVWNGRDVINGVHQIMPHGRDLLGDPSSTSSGLIVPKPEDPTKYYLFTVDEPHHNNASAYPSQFTGVYDEGGSVPEQDDGFNNGLNYSLVDMTLYGGLGDVDVAEKNQHLITYDINNTLEASYKCSEKITAVRAEDCSSFWVITHFGNKFYSFKIDTNGVNTTPVISTIGPNIPIQGYRRNALGYLKASPDATKIVAANYGKAGAPGNNAAGSVDMYDFNNETGFVTNHVELYGPENDDSPYGVEFSAESRKVYATISENPQGNGTSRVYQWDLESPDIINSIRVIHFSNDISTGALQLGIDKRIYRSQLSYSGVANISKYLGVINYPEADGIDANYNDFGILLDINDTNQNKSRIGLPPFIQSLFNSEIDIIQNGISTSELKLCIGESYTLEAMDIPGADYAWSFDGLPLSQTSSDLFVDTPGFYEVYIEPNNGECPIEGRAVVGLFPIPIANDISILQCDEDGIPDGFTTFNINNYINDITDNASDSTIKFYTSRTDAEDQENEINAEAFNNTTNSQIIYARVENAESDCFNISEISLEVSTTSTNNASLGLCDTDGTEDGFMAFNLSDANEVVLAGAPSDLELTYYETYEDALIESNPLDSTFTNSTPYNQTIYARVENANECYGISEIELSVFNLPNIEITDETIYCENLAPETTTLNGGFIDEDDIPNNYSYLWDTGETTTEIEVSAAGTYSVRVSNSNGCYKERTITVLPKNEASIYDIEIVDATQNNTISVILTTDSIGDYEYALNDINGPYQDSNTFTNVLPGLHTVYVRDKNNCGIADDLISVIGFPKFFTPNNDQANDYWQVYGISEQFQANSTIFIYDRYGKLLIELNPLSSGWDGNYNGHKMPTSDYWFKVSLEDGRIFTNHFTLKR